MSKQPLPTLPMWRVDHIEPSPEMLALRANGPIHRVRFPSGHEGWWVTGYDEAKAALSDPAFRPAGMPPAAFTPDSVILGSPGWLVSHEGDEHARLRTIVAPAFSNPRVKLLAQQVEANAAQLFEPLAAQPQPADLRRHLSFASGNGHQRADGRMRKHELLSEAEREQLPGFPADRDDLARFTPLSPATSI